MSLTPFVMNLLLAM
ncbi:hypothetical protein YPPY16_1977, partial [Yersinia pestis PY-16]